MTLLNIKNVLMCDDHHRVQIGRVGVDGYRERSSASRWRDGYDRIVELWGMVRSIVWEVMISVD